MSGSGLKIDAMLSAPEYTALARFLPKMIFAPTSRMSLHHLSKNSSVASKLGDLSVSI